MVSFGTLAAGLGLGTATEYAKRTLGFGESHDPSTLFLNQGNLDRIVDTLCKVRGNFKAPYTVFLTQLCGGTMFFIKP